VARVQGYRDALKVADLELDDDDIVIRGIDTAIGEVELVLLRRRIRLDRAVGVEDLGPRVPHRGKSDRQERAHRAGTRAAEGLSLRGR
jgi:hypothetical protein